MAGTDWKFGLLGCFADKKLCILTFLAPCYAIGKNAQAVGDDCMIHGLLYLLGLNFGPLIRWRMRQQKGITGTMLMDVLVYFVCPCCALVQEAREIGWGVPKTLNEIGRQDDQTMTRE